MMKLLTKNRIPFLMITTLAFAPLAYSQGKDSPVPDTQHRIEFKCPSADASKKDSISYTNREACFRTVKAFFTSMKDPSGKTVPLCNLTNGALRSDDVCDADGYCRFETTDCIGTVQGTPKAGSACPGQPGYHVFSPNPKSWEFKGKDGLGKEQSYHAATFSFCVKDTPVVINSP